MMRDPFVAFAHSVATGPACDPELYYVRHSDPRVVAEVEAWLRRLLPAVLPMIARAYAFGVSPIVLDWELRDLATQVKADGGTRNRTLPGHAHYARAHELFPGDVVVPPDPADRVRAVHAAGRSYGGEDAEVIGQVRAFLAQWDARFGRLAGDGALRRAFKSWATGAYVELWQSRYLEKSVDVPRVGYAPDGKVKRSDGTEGEQSTSLLRRILQSLRGGSAVVVPSSFDANGNRIWDIKTLDLPDRSDVWHEALDRYDVRTMIAFMTPGAHKDGAKADEGVLSDTCQSVASFAAGVLTRMVAPVHRLAHGPNTEEPLVIDNDIPKAKKKLLKEIFVRTCDAEQKLKDGRVYTPSELVHPEILEQLGVRARTVEEAAHTPAPTAPPGAPPKVGRKRDATSDRDERRDNAETEEGAEDTGDEDVDGEERGS